MGGVLMLHRVANSKTQQEKLDIWQLYCVLRKYREFGGKNIEVDENSSHEPPTFEKQSKEVHKSVSRQVENILSHLHNNLNTSTELPFNLKVKRSSIDHPSAGKGVFIGGSAEPGTVLAFHPGLVYLPHQLGKLPDYEVKDERSTYLMSRYDDCIIDANDFDTSIKGEDKVSRPHPMAVGHMINHPPPGVQANLMPYSFDVCDFPQELHYLIPNRYYKKPNFLFSTRATMRSLVFVALNHVKNEELFVNYRLNPDSSLPDWYSPVNQEEDSRRWNA